MACLLASVSWLALDCVALLATDRLFQKHDHCCFGHSQSDCLSELLHHFFLLIIGIRLVRILASTPKTIESSPSDTWRGQEQKWRKTIEQERARQASSRRDERRGRNEEETRGTRKGNKTKEERR
jgi:hypothetical protein